MRHLLIAPRFVDKVGDYYDFPVGMAYVSAMLKRAGHEVAVINLNHVFANEVKTAIHRAMDAFEPDVVGCGGLSPHFAALKTLCGLIRSHRRPVHLLIGGGISSSEPECMLTALGADSGVIGEGEITILDLARALERGDTPAGVPGLVWRAADGTVTRNPDRPIIDNLESLPFPDLDGFEADTYLSYQRTSDTVYMNALDRPRLMPVITSRSCPYNCTFCFHPLGRKYRTRSLDHVFAEIDGLVGNHHINMLAVLDELFSMEKERVALFCQRIKPYGLKWVAQLRVDQVDRDTLAMLKDAGLIYISYGLESASDVVLDSMRKHITVPQIEKALALTSELGIGIQGNFILGDPAETLETARETVDWWIRHARYHINFTALVPYPGSRVYQQCLDKGIIEDKLAYIEQGCPLVNMTALDSPDFAKIFAMAYQATFEHRQYCEVVDVTLLGHDWHKRMPLLRLTIVCPHCGQRSVYDAFHKETLEIFKIVCRHCRQASDISSATFPTVRQRYYTSRHDTRLIERLEALRRDRTPIALTPVANPFEVEARLQLLGFSSAALDIRCVLDWDRSKEGETFLGKPVFHRSAANVLTRCADHAFLILPCEQPDRIRDQLQQECGVEADRILSLDAFRQPDPERSASPEEVRDVLARLDSDLPGRLDIAPGFRLINFVQDLDIRRLLRDWQAAGVKHPAVACPMNLLNVFLEAAEAAGFCKASYVDESRRTPFNAFSQGIGYAVPVAGIGPSGIDALALVNTPEATRIALEAARTSGRLPKSLRLVTIDPTPAAEEMAGRLARDIAAKINALQLDVLYVGEFVYYNFCKQSEALRERGWRTGILLQNPASMEGKDDFFNGVFSSYESLLVLFQVLRAVTVPIVHVQAWLGCPHLPPLVLAAAGHARCVVEFNDMPELVGWDAVAELFGPDKAALERLNFTLILERADGIVYNLRSTFARQLSVACGVRSPILDFHTYPSRKFAAPPAVPRFDGSSFRLAFIGSVAPSSLPVEGFGDVQMIHLARELLAQGLGFEIFLAPFHKRNLEIFADYRHLESREPRFKFRDGLEQPALTPVLTAYDFGVMCYRLPDGFHINRRHFENMLPTKFFTFMEACLPVIVSEELTYVAEFVRDHGLGLVVSQSDLGRLTELLTTVDTVAVRRNIAAFREGCFMEQEIGRMETFYRELTAGNRPQGDLPA